MAVDTARSWQPPEEVAQTCYCPDRGGLVNLLRALGAIYPRCHPDRVAYPYQNGGLVYIGVVHRISDSEKFFAAAQETLASLPSGLIAQQVLPSSDGATCFCVWQASSIEAVREIVDGATSGIAVNEYFE